MPTTVIHIRDYDPSRGDVYIGRAGKGENGYFGNPFPLKPGETRGSVIARFREWFLKRVAEDAEYRQRVLALRNKRLVCFCHPQPCHGNVMAEWIDQQPHPTLPTPTRKPQSAFIDPFDTGDPYDHYF